jgi:hypothetical protein
MDIETFPVPDGVNRTIEVDELLLIFAELEPKDAFVMVSRFVPVTVIAVLVVPKVGVTDVNVGVLETAILKVMVGVGRIDCDKYMALNEYD